MWSRQLFSCGIIWLGTLCGACPVLAIQDAESPATAIVGVSIVNVVSGEIEEDCTILVSGDQIEAAGPNESVEVPEDAVRIEGGGLFAIPECGTCIFTGITALR